MKARHTHFLALGAMESYPVEDTVDEWGISRDGVDDGPRQVLDHSQKLHLIASILSIGERNNIDVRMRDSDTKMRANRHGRVARARVRRAGEILR